MRAYRMHVQKRVFSCACACVLRRVMHKAEGVHGRECQSAPIAFVCLQLCNTNVFALTFPHLSYFVLGQVMDSLKANQCAEVNTPLLEDALKLRSELAALLGYPSHAAYVLEVRHRYRDYSLVESIVCSTLRRAFCPLLISELRCQRFRFMV